jgi:hypothetical protein
MHSVTAAVSRQARKSTSASDTRQWRYAPHMELLPNKCDLEVARRYIGN